MMGRGFILIACAFTGAVSAEPITITVTNVEGEPAAGAEVFCVPWHSYGCRTEPLPDGTRQIADENGEAQFVVEGTDQYILYARQGRFGVHDRYYPNREDSTGRAAIQLEYARRITGTIRDDNGQPLEGVQIMGLSTVPLGETDENGYYDIYPMGRYDNDMWLYKPGYVAKSFSFAFDFSIYDIILSRGVPIRGTVTWSDGAPAVGAQIRGRQFLATSNANGEFTFPPQQFQGNVNLYASVDREQLRAVRTEGKLDPRTGEAIELRLPFTEQQAMTEAAPMPEPPVAYATGRVTTRDGDPVRAEILERWSDGHEDAIGQSDEDGRFRVKLNHYEGVFPLVARPLSPVLCMLGEPKRIKANADEDTVVNFIVTDAAYISGKLHDSAGQPIAEKWVMLRNGSHPIRQSYTTEQGSFAFPNTPITGKPVTLEVRFRGQAHSTKVELAPLKPKERRRNVVIEPPARESVLRGKPAVIFASRSNESPRRAADPLRLAQANQDVAPESAEPNFVPVRIMVVDRAGNPVPRVRPSFEPRAGTAESGVNGEMLFYYDWVGPVSWTVREAYAKRVVYINEFNRKSESGQKVNVISANLSAETPEQLLDLRIVVEPPQWGGLSGRVLLEDGRSSRYGVSARVLRPGRPHSSDRLNLQDGWFLSDTLPNGPYAIEFQAQGYQPRVIASGMHFEIDDGEPIFITLPRGPMPKGVSAWTTVTGQPATQVAVDAFPAGDVVRSRERDYYRTAAEDPRPDPGGIDWPQALPAQEGIPQPPYRVRIVDENGEPLDQIYYQGAGGPAALHAFRGKEPPDLGRPYEFLRGEDGWYSLPVAGVTVWADGKGFEWFPQAQRLGELPERIVLYDATTFRLFVHDWDGNPLRNVIVVEAGRYARLNSPTMPNYLATTDGDGLVVLANWSPGPHLVNVVRDQQTRDVYPVVLDGEPGATVSKTVTVGPWPEGSPPATLEAWRERHQFRVVAQPVADDAAEPEWVTKPREEREQLIADLSRRERNAIGKEVLRQLEEAPAITGWSRRDTVPFLAAIAVALEIEAASAPLKRWLAAYQRGAPHDMQTGTSWTDRVRLANLQQVAAAIIALDEQDAAEYFGGLAANPDASPTARAAAVVGLGMLGTEDALDVWRELRDAAYESGHIAQLPEYTHHEKMAEGLMMTLFGIPATGAESGMPPGVPVIHPASVDEDYEYGSVSMGDAYTGGTGFRMRRFGPEWLVVWVGDTVIS